MQEPPPRPLTPEQQEALRIRALKRAEANDAEAERLHKKAKRSPKRRRGF